jgi:pyruvate/2-oxoglutarate/acetoin dehydrogenase E1 component
VTTATAARELTFSQAINDALRLAMRRDPTVIVLGGTSPAPPAASTSACRMPGVVRCAQRGG